MPQHEVKYVGPLAAAARFQALLETLCAPEPGVSSGTIHSVYYDTADWRSYAAKDNSDLLKAKVRVRWYGDGRGRPTAGPCWVEAKFKDGAQRSKLRYRSQLSGEEAARLPLHHPLWRRQLEHLRDDGMAEALLMEPVYQVSYRRHRFHDSASATRLCLDSGITVPRSNRLRCPVGRADPLPWTVFEQKGDHADLLPRLGVLAQAGLRRSSFSKYQLARLHIDHRAE